MTLAEQIYLNMLFDERYRNTDKRVLALRALESAEIFEIEKAKFDMNEHVRESPAHEHNFDPIEHFLNCVLNSTPKRSHGRV